MTVIYAVVVTMICLVALLAFANFHQLGPASVTGSHSRAKRRDAPRVHAGTAPASRATPAAPAAKPAAPPPPKPLLEWDAPLGTPARASVAVAPQPEFAPDAAPPSASPRAVDDGCAFIPTHFAGDAAQRRIRDRYISLRFPGVALSSADLAASERVIKAARLYFDEKKTDRALELLELAIEQSGADESLRLAQLEIAFLARDARLYCALAREFQSSHAASSQLEEVSRLGRALAPDDPIFGAAQPLRAHEHYGPWPDTPNWIQAPWDLTAEILGSDHHRAMQALLAQDAP